jgi:hypothetical protein
MSRGEKVALVRAQAQDNHIAKQQHSTVCAICCTGLEKRYTVDLKMPRARPPRGLSSG